MRNILFFSVFLLLFTLPLVVLTLYVVSPGWTFPDIIPESISDYAFAYLAEQKDDIARHMLSSVWYSTLTTVLTLALCILPAHHFARHRFPAKFLLEGLLLAPALVPAMTFSMGVHYLFIRAGLADTTLGVVLALSVFSYPFMLRALIAGFESYGREYELCAANLGAGWWMRLTRVELPLLMPAIVAGSSVVFLVAFSDYFLVFLIGGGSVASYTGYLFPFLNDSNRSIASLLTLLFLFVPISLFLIIEIVVSRVYRKRGMY